MRILQLSPQVPFPLSVGGKVGIFNITKHLARRGHEITMLAFEGGEPVDARELEVYCRLIRVPHSNRNSIAGAAANIFSNLPYNISKYYSRRYRERLLKLLHSANFDVVHVDHLHMAHYGVLCKENAQIPIVLREHNVESVIMERFAEQTNSGVLGRWLSIQVPRIRAYEARMVSRFDHTCVITPADGKRLRSLAPDARINVVPGGVEASFFEQPRAGDKIPSSISFFGNFDWIPNQDAAIWFLEEVFPKITTSRAEATVFIIGKNIPRKIYDLQSTHIVIRGFVPDVRQEIQRYEINIVPLRIGGGIRLKILESFALRVPVVSTSIGCEGIEATKGEHLLIADTAEGFAAEVVRLLNDGALGEHLAENAFALADRCYRWEQIAAELERVYEDAIALNAGTDKQPVTQEGTTRTKS